MNIELSLANVTEAEYLSKLCLESKQYWGYSDAFMTNCIDELSFKATDFDDSIIVTARVKNKICGVAQLRLNIKNKDGELVKLFVHPNFISQGVGTVLYHWAMNTARENNIKELLLDADPNAEAFYIGHGAIKIADVPSASIVGRVIPQLKICIHNEKMEF